MEPVTDPWPRRAEIMRGIGAGFGTLAGVCLLFLSFPLGTVHAGRLSVTALAFFAAALPLLSFCAVAAFSLSWIPRAERGKPHVRRMLGATILFGLLGALGTVVGMTLILWGFAWPVGVAFVSGTAVACLVYCDFMRGENVSRQPTPATSPHQ